MSSGRGPEPVVVAPTAAPAAPVDDCIDRIDRIDRWTLVALGVVAAALRLVRLSATSLWVDEVRAVLRPDGRPFFDSVRQSFGPLDPPLSYVLTSASRHLPFGLEASVRLPYAIAGAFEVVFAYLVMRRLARRRLEAVVVGVLLAFAPFAIRWGQEARYYVLFSMLHLAAWWALLRVIDRRRYAYTTWGVVLTLAVYTNVLAWLVLAVQSVVLAVVLIRRSRTGDPVRSDWWRVVGAAAIPVLAFLPWALYEARYWVAARRRGMPIEFNREVLDVKLNATLYVDVWRWLSANAFVPLAVTAAVLAVLAFAGSRWRLAGAFSAYFAFVVAVMVGLSRLMHTYLAFRRIEFLVPVALGLVALGVGASSDRLAHWLGDRPALRVGVAGALVAVLVTLSVVADVTYFRTEKTDYRSAAAAVRAAPGAAVVVLGSFNEVGNAPWAPSIRAYFRAAGVERPLRSLDDLGSVPPAGDAIWITGAPGPDARFQTEAVNDIDRLQFLVGDRSLNTFSIPVYVLRSRYDSPAELASQAQAVGKLPYVVPVARP
ncbi:MAG: glycosyltransferase family 39 protein [Acidimicrobiia bacterium]